ncbi:MAG TPA: hypothetical protein VES42_18430 [Pilimelia sp.]|nr:hypothetical protein [Pilimelia sp.]
MDRVVALLKLECHQPYRLLFVLRIVRCARCRIHWPCPAYLDARSALLTPTRLDISATLRRDNSPRWPW